MARVVFVLLDGLAAATARRCMSYMQSLEGAGKARYAELTGELPPLSRPIYVTLLSGLRPEQSGITHNDDSRPCPAPTIFSRAHDAGLTTAAAAYHSGWGTVDALLQKEEHSEDGLTLSGFPYNQMHHYVEKITACYAKYTELYGA